MTSKLLRQLWMKSVIFFTCFIFTACGPSEEEINVASTLLAADDFATQTAAAPTATLTPSPTGTVTPTSTPDYSQPVNMEGGKKLLNWLVSVEEIEEYSQSLGIGNWEQLDEVFSPDFACRAYEGHSVAAAPNVGINCVYAAKPGLSVTEMGEWYMEQGFIQPDAVIINTSIQLEQEFVVYQSIDKHMVFDILVLKKNLLYWANVDLVIPLGCDMACVYEGSSSGIDSFLTSMIERNMENVKATPEYFVSMISWLYAEDLEILDNLPTELEVFHNPNPVYARDGGPGGSAYSWVYDVTVSAPADPVRITEFAAFVQEEGRWYLDNDSGEIYSQRNFNDWYSCSSLRITFFFCTTYGTTWRTETLEIKPLIWVFIGVLDDGTYVKGLEEINLVAELSGGD